MKQFLLRHSERFLNVHISHAYVKCNVLLQQNLVKFNAYENILRLRNLSRLRDFLRLRNLLRLRNWLRLRNL